MVSGAKFSANKVYQHYLNGCFLPQQALSKKSRLEGQWQFWEKPYPALINTLSTEGLVTSKKVKRRPPIHTKEFRSGHSSLSSHTGYYQH